MKINCTYLILAILLPMLSFAQVGINTTSPDASAILDIESSTMGFLPPRMTTTQRNNIASPAEGLTIFNTTHGFLEFYNGTNWITPYKGSCISTSQPIAGVVQEESNIQVNETNFSAINDGLVVEDDGVTMNNVNHYMVLDLGQVYAAGTIIKLDIWGNAGSRTAVTSETPGGTYLPDGGSNPLTTNVSVTTLGDYSYTLQNATRYIQIDMTVRTAGRTTWVEATITNSCF